MVAKGNVESDIWNSFKENLCPPVLNQIEEMERWLRELAIRQCVTQLEPRKQGPIVYLSLLDKICKNCNDVSIQDLNKDDGLNI